MVPDGVKPNTIKRYGPPIFIFILDNCKQKHIQAAAGKSQSGLFGFPSDCEAEKVMGPGCLFLPLTISMSKKKCFDQLAMATPAQSAVSPNTKCYARGIPF